MSIRVSTDGDVTVPDCPHKWHYAGVIDQVHLVFYPVTEAYDTPPMTAQDLRDLADYMDGRALP